MFETMVEIRQTEELLANLCETGEVVCPCHLYIGQEAVAAGVCAALLPSDTIWGAHRSHGHYLAKGGSLEGLLAEVLGRVAGCAGGRGGSMHLIATEVGLMGTVPLVSATIPLAVGAGLAAHLAGSGQVSVSFFGDGAAEEGHFHESMNLAASLRLPVVFVCENNLYASHMALLERRAADNIVSAASAHGMDGKVVDGNDVEAVFSAANDAVNRARAGGGPSLIECRTFRWRGHVGPSWDMDVGVARKDELKNWLIRDPIARARALLLDIGATAESAEEVEVRVRARLDAAIEVARQSPFPDSSTLEAHVFSAAEVA